MKLTAIALQNFRLFTYRQRIEFDSSPGLPLTIVRAENRTGKTTLLIALQWCLYGERAISDPRQRLKDGYEIAPRAKAFELGENGELEVMVSVEFAHEGEAYIASRRMRVQRGTEQGQFITSPPSFTVLWKKATGAEEKSNPDSFIDQILPFHLRELFFFDGDRIDTLMKPDHEDIVQRAVSEMLEFELFDTAIKDLETAHKEYSASVKNVAVGQEKLLREEEEKLRENKETLIAKVAHLDDQIRAEETSRQTIIESLTKAPGDAGDIQKSISDTEDQIKAVEGAVQTIAGQFTQSVTGGEYFAIPQLLEVSRNKLADMKEKGEIPRRIGEDLINERLSLGMCICDRPLSEGDPPHTHLSTLLTTIRERPAIQETANEILYFVNSLARRDLEKLKENLAGSLAKRSGHLDSIRSMSAFILQQRKKLGEIDVDYVQRLKTSLDDVVLRIQAYTSDKSHALQQIENQENQLSEVTKKRVTAEKRDAETQKIRGREAVAKECLDTLRLTYFEVREIERKKVSDETAKNFFRMNIAKEFASVEVTPSFKLNVYDAATGQVANSTLSGAQSRALSLSFLLALVKVSEREAPIVVDTPLGVISKDMKQEVCRVLLEESGQLVLLLTRAEIYQAETILNEKAKKQVTLTNNTHSDALVKERESDEAFTEVCDCKITEHCDLCMRVDDEHSMVLRSTSEETAHAR